MTAAFKMFVDMICAIGLKALYILVDRVDELPDTTCNLERASALVEPLVTHLPLMETPSAAFKFFLPTELSEYLLPKVRTDRLLVSQIEWNELRLQQLLEERLIVYSDGRIRSLAQISTAALSEMVDIKLIKIAEGSPRRLLVMGNKLFLTHCRHRQMSELLTVEDWVRAMGQVARVRVCRDRPIVFVDEEQMPLTDLEYKFLACLLNHHGKCGKETLADQVWNAKEGVSDQAISRLVLRLRQKIELDPSIPVHLITERGIGFQLSDVDWG